MRDRDSMRMMSGRRAAGDRVTTAPIRLGLFGGLKAPPARPRLGAHVAREGFVEALLRHSTAESIEIVMADHEVAAMQAVVSATSRSNPAGPAPRVEVLPRLPDLLRTRQVTAWHDPRGHIFPCIALRQLQNGHFPITTLHHAVSYPHYLHALFARYLTADLRPYDSLICATPTTRTAIENQLAHVQAAVARVTGAEIRVRARLDVLPLGIDTELFRPRPKPTTRAGLKLPRDAFIILWLARLSAFDKADPLPLLRMFERLVARCQGHDLLLVMAGHPGPVNETRAIQSYCRDLGLGDRVRFIADTTERHLLYAAADAFVSPIDNIQETFGLTPIEAMACGVPQVVSDWDGYRHTVVHGVTGFRVPTLWTRCDQDAADLAVLEVGPLADHMVLAQSVAVDLDATEAALAELVDNPALTAEMSRRSREHAVASYDWAPVVRQYEELWRELQEIALRDREPSRPGPWVDRPVYFDAFRGLATRCLEDDAVILATPAGRDARLGREPWPTSAPRALVIDPEIAHALLDELGAAQHGCTLAALEAALETYPPSRVRRHVMWLLKFGFAATATPPLEPGGAP